MSGQAKKCGVKNWPHKAQCIAHFGWYKRNKTARNIREEIVDDLNAKGNNELASFAEFALDFHLTLVCLDYMFDNR